MNSKEFFKITTYCNSEDTKLFISVVNQGIDSYLDCYYEHNLELVKKFKVGDKVKILSKSTGWSFAESSVALQGYGFISEIESYRYVVKKDKDSSGGGYFLEKDLELIKEGEEKMEKTKKYEIIHTLFTTELIKAQGSVTCSKFNARLVEFIKMFGAVGVTKSGDVEKFFDEFATQEDLAWLEQKGFIKKKEEVFYKSGDIFKSSFNEYYTITFFHDKDKGYMAYLVVICGSDRGNRNNEPIAVKDVNKITQEELEKMSGFSTFTFIKNATVNMVI